MKSVKRNFLIWACIVFAFGFGELTFAQDCEHLFDSEELKNELYTDVVRKNVFQTKPGKIIFVNAFFFGNKGYLLNFISGSGSKLSVKLWNKNRTKVLFDSRDADGITSLQVSYSRTEKVVIEIDTYVAEGHELMMECVGLLIRTFDDEKLGINAPPAKNKKDLKPQKSVDIPTVPDDEW